MSTASRDCGSAGGARAGAPHAGSVPGVNGKPRGYYGPRAQKAVRQSHG